MARTTKLVGAFLALCLLLAPPGLAWYKQVAGPNYYSVGRASGLLSGFRRSPYAPRSEPSVGTGHPGRAGAPPESRPSLRSLVSAGGGGAGQGSRGGSAGRRGPRERAVPSASPCPQAVCVKEVSPNLQSCEQLPDGRATFQCKANVFLSLRAADCRSV